MAQVIEPFPVAYVEWVDSAIVQGVWTEPKRALKRARKFATSPMRSAGLLLDNGPDSITLALNHNPNNSDIAMVFVIPRKCITALVLYPGEAKTGDST